MGFGKNNELNTILDSITDGFLLLDSRWNFKYVNTAFENLTGIKREACIGKNYWETFPKAKDYFFMEQCYRAVEEKMAIQYEEFNPRMELWFSINLYPYDGGLTIYYRNITEDKKRREKVLEDEHNLRILINNTDDPIWAVDKNCEIIVCNNAFKTWIHYFTGKYLEKGDNILSEDLPMDYINKFQMCYQLSLSGKTFQAVEDMKLNGETHYTTVSFNPVKDYQENVIGVSCFARDITEQRQHLYKIEEQNRALIEIAALESHKVRRPVANILGLVQLFNEKDFNDKENKLIIDNIKIATEELDSVIVEIVEKSNQIGL